MSEQPNPPAWDAPAPHVLAVDVTDAHIDLMQHVNNVRYLQWLENVAWDHSVALGMRQADYTRLGHGMVVRRHELDYVAPALLGDRVLLATWIVADGTTLFRGATHFVCVEIASGKVRRMPPAFTEAYAGGLTAS